MWRNVKECLNVKERLKNVKEYFFETEKIGNNQSIEQLKNFLVYSPSKIPNIGESEQNRTTSVTMVKCQKYIVKQTKKLLKKDSCIMIQSLYKLKICQIYHNFKGYICI